MYASVATSESGQSEYPLAPKNVYKVEIGDRMVGLYKVINLIACLAHLVNAALMVVLYYTNDEQDVKFDLKATYGTWNGDNVNNSTGPTFTVTRDVFYEGLSLHWTILAFHTLSFLFQGLAATPLVPYEEWVEKRGQNPLRFIEYSISAPLMLVCIALLSAVDDFVVISVMTAACSMCQILGLVGERMQKTYNLFVVHSIAWGLTAISYAPILFSFFYSQHKREEAGGEEPPMFVVVIIFSIAGLFMSFGVVQFAQLYGQSIPLLSSIGENSEISYTVLSLVSKTLLGWMIYSYVIING